MPIREVPVDALREAFIDSGLTRTEVAARAGWRRHDGRGDGSRLARVLGLIGWAGGRCQEYVSYSTADVIARAMGMQLWEITDDSLPPADGLRSAS